MGNESLRDYVIGPAEVYVNNVLLGETAADTHLKVGFETVASKLAKTGNNPRKKYVTRDICTLEGVLSEVTLAQFATLSGGTLDPGDVDSHVRVKSRVGAELTKVNVVLKPIIAGATSADAGEWIYIPAATIESNMDVVFGVETQKDFAFTIEGHPVTADEIESAGRLADDTIAWAAGDIYQIGVSADA